MPTDDDLAAALRATQAGDAAGFATLWRALQPAVPRHLHIVTGDHAEDAASETWLHVTRDLHRFHGDPAAFRGWLFRIARHRGIDERRRHERHPTTAQPDAAIEALEETGTT